MKGRHLLSIDDLELADIDNIMQTAQVFKEEFLKTGRVIHCIHQEQNQGLVVQLLFAEPSTRTRASFESACGRLGIATTSLWNLHFSSMAKGETLEDTIQCLIALKPNMIILRCGIKSESDFLKKSPIPIVNAGLGVEEHPTQALVDAFTIQQLRGQVKGQKVLIIGDVLYSRVANSNVKLLNRMGAELGMCAPEELRPKNTKVWEKVTRFETVESGVKWADVIMCLRVQKERHAIHSLGFSMAEYRDKYHISEERMNLFRKDGLLLHPGPAIRGVEIDSKVLKEPRCHIITQVENSSYVRSAVICLILKLKLQKP